MVLHEVETGPLGRPESLIVVTGGPGSGKSVIALSLLGELARRGRTVLARNGFQILYADAAQGGRQEVAAGAEDVQVL